MTPLEQAGDIPALETECGGPCHPDAACPACIDYWARMIAEGYWDEQRSQWTDKGWADILRHA